LRRARKRAWRKDPDGRRERILSAAARLFGDRGFAAVRTREIALAAGVSEGTLFHHYHTKQSILLAVAERYGAGFAAAMFEDVGTAPAVPSVDRVIRRAFAYVRHSDPRFGVFLLSDDTHGCSAARSANREAIVSRLRTLFSDWKRRRLAELADPRVAAELCFAVVESALRECFVGGQRADEDRYVAEAVRAVRAMVRPRDPGRA
jgi:AcrR family transcriptional regulator